MQRLKVLIVEDSLMFRRRLEQVLARDPDIEVIATAGDPSEARLRIMEQRPDVITCDVEMPVMDGISFVRWLIPQLFIPVVMVSSVSEKVFEAMEAGAVDFVVKPNQLPHETGESFENNLIRKVKAAANATATLRPVGEVEQARVSRPVKAHDETIIAIGASTGGTDAIFRTLKQLPPQLPGMLVVQHIPPVFSRMFADRLNNHTDFIVKEAQTGDRVEPGTVLIAPGDRHMRVRRRGTLYSVECFTGPKVSGHCPSVDVLFDSVAESAGRHAVAVLLTGMGIDGAKGMLNIRNRGGCTIGQDQATSVVYGMPAAAQRMDAVAIQAPLQQIPKEILLALR